MFDTVSWRARLIEMRKILETDRSLLLSGQIEKLSRQDQRRLAIETKLHQMPLTVARAEEGHINHLRRLAARNHRLLLAYIEGARRATKRLTVAENNRGRIGAYRRDGSLVSSANALSTRQQRA